jgi:2,5-diketo-D-gluconate reductase A
MADSVRTPEIPHDAAVLPGGGHMPLLGFGTWQLKGDTAAQATEVALQAGYRHLDTATIYDNEREVGGGLRNSGLAREEVFVTTKCPPDRASRELDTLEQSLELLGTDHVDLWLIHWTPDQGAGVEIWEKYVEARARGLATDIGVSNYSVGQVDELAAATGVRPAVNQIKWTPLLFDGSVVDGHRERGVTLEGYSGLKGGTLENPTIREVAEQVGRTPAQVIVRWHLQHGIVTIPKSQDPDRIRANADVASFELSADDMAALDALGVGS